MTRLDPRSAGFIITSTLGSACSTVHCFTLKDTQRGRKKKVTADEVDSFIVAELEVDAEEEVQFVSPVMGWRKREDAVLYFFFVDHF